MAVDSVGASSGAALQGPEPTGGDGLGKDDFMKLLIAQMSHQDPLSPVENGEFIAQLAQFSSLESMNAMRDSIDMLSLLQSAATNAQVASMVGREIVARGDGFELGTENSIDLSFRLASEAERVEVTVYDDEGNKVRTLSLGRQEAGEGSFSFDGFDDNGNRLPEGDYTFSLAAFDADDQIVDSLTLTHGHVSGVSFENGYPELLIGEQKIPLGNVIEISE